MKPPRLRSIPLARVSALGAQSAEVARIWIADRARFALDRQAVADTNPNGRLN